MVSKDMERFSAFIQASPTSFHAAAELARQLDEAGYIRQSELEPFSAAVGGHYFVRDGACMAWWIPENPKGFRIVGSHTDSPSFKLKPNPVRTSAGFQQCGMEVYGGPLLNSWLNRDLGLAGRMVTKDGVEHLVETGPIMVIPQLAPHLDRSVNDNLHLDRQENLMPFYAVGSDLDVVDYLCEQAGIKREDLGYYDIHAVDTQAPGFVGTQQEFFAAWRMDNLSSAFCSLEAMLAATPGDDIMVMAAFDHEEVGSSTRTGAAGPILEDLLRRVAASLGKDEEGYRQMIAVSSCISADAGHSVNPNYVGKHDPGNKLVLNGGPVLKINGNQRYATDANGGALWFRCCEAAGVPSQAFVGNNDVPCGSTIGPITATRLGLLTVDVGIPLLSMHSARELCGCEDIPMMTKVLTAYYSGK